MISLKKQLVMRYLSDEKYIFGSSNILTEEKEKEEQIKFLKQSLNNPKSIELLYRGSENEFSAKKFH